MADPSPTLPATIRWPSETTRPAEHFAQVYRGEAIRISCVLTEYAKPIDLTGASVSFYWQPIGADDPTAWWEAPNGAASASGNAVSIVFDAATMDDGHGAYRAFFRIVTAGGATYRANGVLGMLESPGATPNEIPFPVRTLDFATVTVLNAPYWTKEEADARFASVSDATLNGRGYGPWAADPASIEFPPDSGETVTFNTPELGEYDTPEGTAYGWYWLNPDGVYIGLDSTDPDATEFSAEWQTYDITFTRTALPGYVLGNQTEKPLADADTTAAALTAKYEKPSGGIPKTDLAQAVQTSLDKADAALPTSGGTMSGNIGFSTNGRYSIGKRDGVSGLTVYDHQAEVGSDLVPNGSPFAHENQIPAVSAETWTFTLDDDTTVTKSVAVFAQAAQGGA